MENHNPYDPYATPLFDEWGWGDYWEQTDWRTWHAAMSSAWGPIAATDKFVNTWNSRTGFFEGFGDVRADWVALDPSFRAWAASHTMSNGMTMLEALENSVVLGETMGPVVEDVNEGIQNVGATVKNTTNTLKWLLPIALIGLVVLGYFIIKSKSNLIPTLK